MKTSKSAKLMTRSLSLKEEDLVKVPTSRQVEYFKYFYNLICLCF